MAKGPEFVQVMKIDYPRDILCCKFSPSKEYMVAGATDGSIAIYKEGTGELLYSIFDKSITDNVITCVKFRTGSPKNAQDIFVSTGTQGYVRYWNCKTGEMISETKENRQTLGATFHPKTKKFLTYGDNAALHLYDEETMTVEQVFERGLSSEKADGHTSRIFDAVFHPQSINEFISGGWDDTIQFWDIRQPNAIRYITGAHICGEGIDIHRSGRDIVTCSYQKENSLQLWHYKSGKLLADLLPDQYKPMLYCGKFMGTDYIITGGSNPSILRVVSSKTYTTAAMYMPQSTGVYSVDYYVKPAHMQKEKHYCARVLFTIGKTLIECDLML